MGKLNWGMVGGGEGSQIGPAHRLVRRPTDTSISSLGARRRR